jgi:hypothetical protein
MNRAAVTILVLVGSQPALAHPDPDVLGDRELLAGDPPSVDDLLQAADATAEVAAVPAPASSTDAAAPAPAPASPDIDLGSLGLDPEASFDDKLNLYGFADVGHMALHWSRDLGFTPQNSRSFFVGNLNLYVAKNITQRARALAEVRFTFLPNGHRNADGTYISTTADDVTNATRPTQWGGIMIERAHVEYDLTEHLTIRAGRWLTPYGIWNTDHGSPTIIAISRPFIIGEEFLPEHQTGLQLFGSHHQGDFKVTYHATASNGRGGTEAVDDRDNAIALGGSVQVETPWGLKAGASYYRGRYTALPESTAMPAETYREAAYAADAQLVLGGLHLQAELIMRDRHYDPGERMASGVGFAPDSRLIGTYVLAGYRFNRLWNVMPFAYVEFYDPAGSDQHIGLNFRPAAPLVLKLQATRVAIEEGESVTSGARLFVYGAQASWMF